MLIPTILLPPSFIDSSRLVTTVLLQCCTADMACQPQPIRPCVAHHRHNDRSLSHHLNLLLHLHERRTSCWMHNKAVYCFTDSCCSICVRLQRSENVPVVTKRQVLDVDFPKRAASELCSLAICLSSIMQLGGYLSAITDTSALLSIVIRSCLLAS
jgi:hypothetical protein